MEDLGRGAELIGSLPEVMPEDAGSAVQEVYEDIRETLRVPFVNFLFRTLANDPPHLRALWIPVAPLAGSLAFEEAADRLRKAALLEDVPDASDVEWAALGDLDRIRAFTDSIHYVLPKLLLVSTLFVEMSEAEGVAGRAGPGDGESAATEGAASSARRAGSSAGRLSRGAAPGTASVAMVDPATAPEPVRRLLEDVRERHEHPGAATYYRALANWPPFLEAVWERLRPLVGRRAYAERRSDLTRLAARLTRELETAEGGGEPRAVPEPAEAAAETRPDLSHVPWISVLEVFRLRLIPDLLLDVTLVRAMLDGPEKATVSPFSQVRSAEAGP